MNDVRHKEKVVSDTWNPESMRLGSAKEVAVFLGCTVGHIYNLAYRKELLGNKASGLKFKGVDVQNFIDEREKR